MFENRAVRGISCPDERADPSQSQFPSLPRGQFQAGDQSASCWPRFFFDVLRVGLNLKDQPNMQSTIVFKRRSDPFTRIPNDLLCDPALSWKAKGVLCYLLGKPDGWKLRRDDLVNQSKDGETAVRSSLKELREAGYVALERVNDEKGRFKEWIWTVCDTPCFLRPDVGFQHAVKTPISKTDLRKTESLKGLKGHQLSTKAGESEKVRDEIKPVWKPIQESKSEQLAVLPIPKKYPSEREFSEYLEMNGLDLVASHRSELYETLCARKWRHWDGRKWHLIRDWKSYVVGLNSKITEAKQS